MGEKRDSRELILATATRLFHLQGYHATGLNQIISESKMPKGSLYYHFPGGKEQLAIEAVNQMAVCIESEINRVMDRYEDVVEAFQAHIEEAVHNFDHYENHEGIHVGLIASETAFKSEPLRLACKKAFELWEATYQNKLLQGGYSQNEAIRLSIVISSMIEGAITHSLAYRNCNALKIAGEMIPVLLKK